PKRRPKGAMNRQVGRAIVVQLAPGGAPWLRPERQVEVREMDRRDRIEKTPIGLRWIDDAFHVLPTAGGFVMCLADMTRARAAIRLMRDARIPVTMAHLGVRACALVLARNPQWHRLVCNYRRLTPATVDIGLSMAGRTTYAPGGAGP